MIVPCALENNCILQLLMVKVVDNVLILFFFLFFYSVFITFWEKGVKLFYDCTIIYVPLVLSIFVSCALRVCYEAHMHLWLLCLPDELTLLSLWVFSLYLWTYSLSLSLFIWYYYNSFRFLILTICMVCLFPSNYFQSISVFIFNTHLLEITRKWILVFNIFC